MDSEASTNLKDLDETEFCQWLKDQKFKPDVVTAFEEADVDGSAFLCITEQSMKDMGLKIGPITKLLALQSKYKPNQTQMTIPPSTTKLAREIRDFSTKLESEPGPPQVYKLPIVQTAAVHKKGVAGEEGVVMCEVGKSEDDDLSVTERVVMVVGATGAGKTTLINGMANYFFGVQFRDNFRFKVVTNNDERGQGKAKSKTKHITAYHFPRQSGANVPYGLTIIDTPGFGDTEGLKADRRTMAQIRDLFTNSDRIKHLDGIGFVAQSGEGKLTATQRYIFDSILSIFGKDIGDIIFMMTTFADAHRQPVLDAVEEAGIKYCEAFKFNNSALFVDNNQLQGDENFDEMFWKMGMKSFERFFRCIGRVETKSLQLTIEVLHEREELQNLVQSLRPQIQLGLTTIDALHQEEKVVKKHEAEILKAKNFTYQVTVQKQNVINLEGKGVYTTNCLQCSFTCHYECAYSDDNDKINCCAMKNGYCTACPKKCKWDQHKNTPYRYEWYEDVETRTSEDLLRRYNIATSGKSQVVGLMASLENELKEMHQNVLQMVYSTKQSLQRLSEIALKPNPLSTVDYIDTLIEAEKQQGTQGFRDNIKILEELRKEAELLATMNEAEIEDWMRTDHKTIFQRFLPQPAEPEQGWFQKATNYVCSKFQN